MVGGHEVVDSLVECCEVFSRGGVEVGGVVACPVSACFKRVVGCVDVGNDVEVAVAVCGVEECGGGVVGEGGKVDVENVEGWCVDGWAHEVVRETVGGVRAAEKTSVW